MAGLSWDEIESAIYEVEGFADLVFHMLCGKSGKNETQNSGIMHVDVGHRPKQCIFLLEWNQAVIEG